MAEAPSLPRQEKPEYVTRGKDCTADPQVYGTIRTAGNAWGFEAACCCTECRLRHEDFLRERAGRMGGIVTHGN